MALKSAWANKNGKRIMNAAKESLKDEKTGWIEKNGILMYAERYEPTGKLMAKTYSNKKQADNMVEKQTQLGFSAYRSFKWPFLVCRQIQEENANGPLFNGPDYRSQKGNNPTNT